MYAMLGDRFNFLFLGLPGPLKYLLEHKRCYKVGVGIERYDIYPVQKAVSHFIHLIISAMRLVKFKSKLCSEPSVTVLFQ